MASSLTGISNALSKLHLPLQLLVFFTYAAIAWLELSWPLSELHITLFWLPSGIALAAIYRLGASAVPAIACAAALAAYSALDLPLFNCLLIGLGNSLAPLLTHRLLRRGKCDLQRLNPIDVASLLLFTSLGMLPAALMGNLSFWLYTGATPEPLLWVRWWLGDCLGIYLLAPLLINLSRSELERGLRQPRQLFYVLLVSSLVALASFSPGVHSPYWLPFIFISFVCVGWAALSLGIFYSGLVSLGFCLTALLATSASSGLLNMANTSLSAWMLWVYCASLSLLGLMIAATQRQLSSSWKQLKQATQEQTLQQQRLNTILHAIPDLLLETDRHGRCLAVKGNTQLSPWPLEQLLGAPLAQHLPAHAWDAWNLALQEAEERGLSRSKSLRLLHQEQELWLELVVAKNPGATTTEDTYVSLARDITLRRQVHESDLASARRFRQIFENTLNIAVQGYNREHKVIFWNRASEDLYGFSAEAAQGRYLEDLIIPSFMRSDVYNAIESWHEQDLPIPSGELPLQNASGEEVWVYSNHVMIDTPQGREMYCLDIDLRPQRRAMQQLEKELVDRRAIEQALRTSEQQLESAQIMARLAYWEWYPDDDSYHFSRAISGLFGTPEEERQGQLQPLLQRCMSEERQQHFNQQLNLCLSDHSPFVSEIPVNLRGKHYWIEVQGSLDFDDNARPRICGSLQDISERKRMDQALAAAAADTAAGTDFYATLLRALSEALGAEHALISLLDQANLGQAHSHTYLYNGEPQENFSYPLANTPCANVLDENLCFVSTDACARYPDDEMFQQLGIDAYLGVGLRDAQGRHIGILLVMSNHALNVSPQVRSLMMIFAERISGELNRTNIQEQIYQLAFFDPLTRLPNRRMLMDRLRLILGQSERTGQQGALLFIDLDHFKLLNDTRGHHVGDQLLTQVAERISSIIRTTDLAARLGGDEFVVVFDNLGTDAQQAAREAKARAEELHTLVNLPYSLQQTVHHCTISIGVNLFSGRSHSIDDLLRHADVAMYQAKDGGRNTIRFFDPLMQSHLDKRAEIESDLRYAYEEGDQLLPYYQAQVDGHKRVTGAELLLRWQHPRKGLVSPAEFIAVAEQTGLILPIGQQVLHMACKQLQQWHQQPGREHLSLAVNVSPIQFNQANFADEVIALVRRYQFDTRRLKLELTESSLLKNVEQSIEKMQRLQNIGIGFSMDDFGIGYSSLSYLKKLPLDQLKIDQSFVRDIAIDPNDAVIVRTIIAMAENMNLNVIAEGVETETQQHFLAQNGCQMFQGYFFARPLPLAEFEARLDSQGQLLPPTSSPQTAENIDGASAPHNA